MFMGLSGKDMMIKVVIVMAALIIGLASYNHFNLPEDNSLEECSEYIIYKQTGLDIDLSPTSVEQGEITCLT